MPTRGHGLFEKITLLSRLLHVAPWCIWTLLFVHISNFIKNHTITAKAIALLIEALPHIQTVIRDMIHAR